MEPIRIANTHTQYVASLQQCLDAVACERRFLAFVEAPPVQAVTAFVEALLNGAGVQVLALDEKASVVGWCDVVRNPREGFRHTGQLGMGVLPSFRGQGIGNRLTRATIDAAWAANLERIELEVFATNDVAVRLYRKLGFELEGAKRNARKLDGATDDVLLMALLRGRASERGGIATMPSTER